MSSSASLWEQDFTGSSFPKSVCGCVEIYFISQALLEKLVNVFDQTHLLISNKACEIKKSN